MLEKLESRSGDFLLLGNRDRLGRMPGGSGGSCFDFDEHDCLAIQSDEIQFPVAASKLSVEDLVAQPFQKSSRLRFALISEPLPRPFDFTEQVSKPPEHGGTAVKN